MIGVFAKMFGPQDRVAEVTPLEAPSGYEVKATGPAVETKTTGTDEPPSAFVEKVTYEGGDVYVIPFMEAFRAWVRKTRK